MNLPDSSSRPEKLTLRYRTHKREVEFDHISTTGTRLYRNVNAPRDVPRAEQVWRDNMKQR